MKKKLKVLHLASFHGNIGDNANHCGTRAKISKNLDFEFAYTNLEIRRFYWGELSFETDFVELANQHDLVMIGGGNYFELWVEKSHTGTSIDISLDALSKIKAPIFFNALGVDPGQGASASCVEKFKRFIDALNDKNQAFLSVRNDGSIFAVKEFLGEAYTECFHHVPDGGFFTSVDPLAAMPSTNFEDEFVVGINLANDMPEHRFKAKNDTDSNRLTYNEFVVKFGHMITEVLEQYPSAKIIFFAHIFKDLEVISEVLSHIKDSYRRLRVQVAPYASGFQAQDYVFGLYAKCRLVLGMRFHSNVCSISQNVPTVGLANYRQIYQLYNEIDIKDRLVAIDQPRFDTEIKKLIGLTLDDYPAVLVRYSNIKKKLNEEIDAFHLLLNDWLHKHYD